jgi:demethylmenaquinone methyltransferase/2-methoxy-6-polyprenyl-1,4-benzoquinol methylase
MLEIARGKSVPANALMLGDACRLPIADSVFNAVTVGWGIRNVPDIDGAHKEIARVLAPGGRFVSLDMATPKNPLVLAASNLFCQKLVPALGSLFGQREAYTYLPKSTERFWTREMLRESMEAAGFTNCGWKDVMFGNICIHWGTKA